MSTVGKKEQEQRQKAIHFAQSIRGQFILSQALSTAIAVMDKEEYPEISNIEDMKFLRENLFHLFQKISADKKPTIQKQRDEYFNRYMHLIEMHSNQITHDDECRKYENRQNRNFTS